MEIREDGWLSQIFGYGVFKVDAGPPASRDQVQPADVREIIGRHAREQRAAMYYAKVATTEVDLVRQFGAAGLYVVDVNVTFNLETASCLDPAKSAEISIQEAGPEHQEAVLEIAASCFVYSRFHLDPLVPAKIANQIKHDWILNYVRKQRGERLWVASIDGDPVGFLAVIGSELNGRRIHTIDLIGVGRDFQKRGVGRALTAFFIKQYKDRSDLLRVGTQVANIPSMRLYQKLGFYIAQTQYVMHLHVPESLGRQS